MYKTISIHTQQEVDKYIDAIIKSCDITKNSIQSLMNDSEGVDFFHALKFVQIGKDPLNNTPLNFIEQLNQTFTYLVSFEAVKYLCKQYPEHSPFSLNLGTQPGYDIKSSDNKIIAEVFAATTPTSNDKLNKDCEKLQSNAEAFARCVFFYSPIPFNNIEYYKIKYPNVDIIQLQI